MKRKIDLEVQWNLYINFYDKAIYATAYEYIGRIYHYYKYFNQQIPQEMQETFLQPISKQTYEKIYKNMRNYYEKSKRIISIGEFWLDDEWLLMFTYRFELEFMKDFLLDKGLSFPELDLHGLCEEMKAASLVGKKNKQQFQSAVNAITKNTSLPFLDIWFEADQHPRQPIPNGEEK
jgi:hypothetical protein